MTKDAQFFKELDPKLTTRWTKKPKTLFVKNYTRFKIEVYFQRYVKYKKLYKLTLHSVIRYKNVKNETKKNRNKKSLLIQFKKFGGRCHPSVIG